MGLWDSALLARHSARARSTLVADTSSGMHARIPRWDPAHMDWLELGSRSPGGVGVACILRTVRFQIGFSMLRWSLFMIRTKTRS